VSKVFEHYACPEAVRANPFITALACIFGSMCDTTETVTTDDGERHVFTYTTAHWRGKEYWVGWEKL